MNRLEGEAVVSIGPQTSRAAGNASAGWMPRPTPTTSKGWPKPALRRCRRDPEAHRSAPRRMHPRATSMLEHRPSSRQQRGCIPWATAPRSDTDRASTWRWSPERGADRPPATRPSSGGEASASAVGVVVSSLDSLHTNTMGAKGSDRPPGHGCQNLVPKGRVRPIGADAKPGDASGATSAATTGAGAGDGDWERLAFRPPQPTSTDHQHGSPRNKPDAVLSRLLPPRSRKRSRLACSSFVTIPPRMLGSINGAKTRGNS